MLMGKILVVVGVAIASVGLALMFFDRIPFFGKLPGDLNVKRENFQLYFPITSSISSSASLSVWFSGCSLISKENNFMKLLLALFLCTATTFAQQDKPTGTRTISVQGLGKLSTAPDQVRLNVQVNTRAESASEAMAQASRKTSDILALLKGYGIDSKDIQTSRVTVSAILDYQKNIQPPPIVGYTGVNEFSVLFKGKLMDRVGEFLDKAVMGGVTNFSGLMYESSKQRELERDALKRAAADAQARADVLAKELGATLGKVMNVSESVSYPAPVMRGMMMDASTTAAPVMTGEVAINAQVSVTFELK